MAKRMTKYRLFINNLDLLFVTVIHYFKTYLLSGKMKCNNRAFLAEMKSSLPSLTGIHLKSPQKRILSKLGGHKYDKSHIIGTALKSFMLILALSPFILSGCTENRQKLASDEKPAVSKPITKPPEMETKQTEQSQDDQTAPPSPPPKAGSKAELESLQELAHRSTPSDRTPAEYGYGMKTEKEIQMEQPRAPKIAVLGPLTGELEFFGNEASNGAELASDEFDAKGGINGQEFELLVFDTKGQISGARQGIQAFIDNNVLAVVGAATGEVSFSASKQLNDNQLIMISAGSRRRLGDTGPYNFRITLNDPHAVESLIGYIAKEKKWKDFAILSSVVNDYSIKLTASFKNALYNHNLNVTHELFLWPVAMTHQSTDDTSIAVQITKLKKNTPDALIYTGEGKEASEIVREMRKQGVNIPLVGSEDLMIPEFTSLGSDAYGTIVYGGFDVNSENPNIRKFVEAYTRKFGQPPSRLAALSYDAYGLLAQAIKMSPSLRPNHVRAALASIKNFHGVTGKTSISSSGEALKEPFVFEFMEKDGNSVFQGIKEPL